MKNQAETQARSELRDFLEVRDERKRLFPRAMLVGAVAGLVATAFRYALMFGDLVRDHLVAWSHGSPTFGWIAPALFAAIGATLALILTKRVAPEASGSGIPHLEAVLHRYRDFRWRRVLPVKFAGGFLAISAGLALGREGPTVQMGGAIGMAVADGTKATRRERLTLAASGAGAGLAAAFNAPLSGVMFVLEELQRDFRPTVFGAAFLAAACADVVARLLSGQTPSFAVAAYPTPSLALLPAFALLGALAGVLGVLFNRSLIGSLNRFAAMGVARSTKACAVVGALVGLVAFFAPTSVGGGHGLAERALAGHLILASVPVLFALRFVMTMGSYATGAPGGIFAPLLALGALFGLGFGQLVVLAAPGTGVSAGVFAVIGMAAYFTAIVRAPLTGIVLIVEMTQSYAQMLPLIVGCLCAYVAAEAMGDLPIYEALLQRDLLRGGDLAPQEEPIVLEIEVEPHSPFEGRALRELGLPAGVVLVSCRDSHHEWVPTAETRLQAHERITAVVAPEAAEGLERLRAGCRSED